MFERGESKRSREFLSQGAARLREGERERIREKRIKKNALLKKGLAENFQTLRAKRAQFQNNSKRQQGLSPCCFCFEAGLGGDTNNSTKAANVNQIQPHKPNAVIKLSGVERPRAPEGFKGASSHLGSKALFFSYSLTLSLSQKSQRKIVFPPVHLKISSKIAIATGWWRMYRSKPCLPIKASPEKRVIYIPLAALPDLK